MTTVAKIKNAVKALPVEDFNSFSLWFDKFKEEHWDSQTAKDQKSGPLCDLMEEAQVDYKTGKCNQPTVVHARMEPQTKQKAEGVLRNLGISPTEAIGIFYRQIALQGGLPFAVDIPNARTAETIEKSRRGEGVVEFDSLDAMFESWER